MVKVQKPKPKSIKKDTLGNAKKTQLKKGNLNSAKEQVKKIGNTLKNVAENELVVNVQQKVSANKKLIETVKKSPQNKKILAKKQVTALKKSTVSEDQETTVKKNPLKKKALANKQVKKSALAPVQETTVESNPIKKKAPAEVQETALKKIPLKKKVLSKQQETTVNESDAAVPKATAVKQNPLKKKILSEVQKTKAKKNPVKKVQSNAAKTTEKKTSTEKKILIASKSVKKTQLGAKAGIKNIKNGAQKEDKPTDAGKEAPKLFEAIDFNEDNFKNIVSFENIKKISKALKDLVEKEVSEKKTSIFSDYKYILNVVSYKIPNCPKRMVKLNLKHSLVDTQIDDVVMIVPDLKRGAKVDYEPTIQHYEDLLREIGIENIKIVPFNQLRNECTSYEAKIKFANTYDYFMCDGRIVGHAGGFCGKHFLKPRTTLHAVRLDNPSTYKTDIEHALRRTSYKQLHKGDMISIPVGNDRFTMDQLSENIAEVIKQLKTIFPGGYENIRGMHMKIDIKGTSSLPLYINMGGPPAEVPNIIGPREQRMIRLKKEANEILSKFNMSKSGEFVKLNKTQVKQKQKLREVRAALLSKDNKEVDDSNDELDPPSKKKVKKNQNAPRNHREDVESENDSDNTNNEDNDDE